MFEKKNLLRIGAILATYCRFEPVKPMADCRFENLQEVRPPPPPPPSIQRHSCIHSCMPYKLYVFSAALRSLVINWRRTSKHLWLVFFSVTKCMLADLFRLWKCGSGSMDSPIHCWLVCGACFFGRQFGSWAP